MCDTEPQTADGKVVWYFTMSQAASRPDRSTRWVLMTGFTNRDGLTDEYSMRPAPVWGDDQGGVPILLHRVGDDDPVAVLDPRYRAVRATTGA